MSRRSSASASPSPVRGFTVNDIDGCNDKLRRASMLNLLTLITLEADHVLVRREDGIDHQDDDDNDKFLTEAVCESIRQVGDTLRELHDYINGRWDEIRAAEKGGAR